MREDKTLFLFVFRDEYLPAESPSNVREGKSVLAKVFAEVGWECPQILAAMANVSSIYFDRAVGWGLWAEIVAASLSGAVLASASVRVFTNSSYRGPLDEVERRLTRNIGGLVSGSTTVILPRPRPHRRGQPRYPQERALKGWPACLLV
jgi:hypothetical protein